MLFRAIVRRRSSPQNNRLSVYGELIFLTLNFMNLVEVNPLEEKAMIMTNNISTGMVSGEWRRKS